MKEYEKTNKELKRILLQANRWLSRTFPHDKVEAEQERNRKVIEEVEEIVWIRADLNDDV